MLTFLTGEKLSDAQVQLLIGHASKRSLEVYQHLSLEAMDDAYQQAVKRLELGHSGGKLRTPCWWAFFLAV
ncbi:hypothetical protein DESA109040_01585 [Deinococcus saxicola]